ncbi:MAG: hypothetical protein K9N34_01030 [Candidatus Marinimicrobia bacterium]|nr:hypothetical protein [Candidatus Neomarinimicrobiota bacterium]MCF7841161.1 hypothetical protein [Candidatus Neomarinimicrobiota bacterium]MCF7901938.1 hypothetical protein [Candidatus Neomarinimicrobiota bacterium]
MSLIQIPLPKPVTNIRITGHRPLTPDYLGRTGNEDVSPASGESDFSVSSGDVPANHASNGDYPNGNNNGDNIRLKTLKHRISYLEQSLQNARDEAFKSGFSEAERIYLDRQDQELDILRADFRQLLETLRDEYQTLPDQLEPVISDIILRSVHNIVGDLINDAGKSRRIVSHQINSCLNRLMDQQEIRITLSPDQHTWLNGSDELDTLRQSSTSRVILNSDPKLKPGECRVESDDFILEGTLDRQLANLRQELFANQDSTDNPPQPDTPSTHE